MKYELPCFIIIRRIENGEVVLRFTYETQATQVCIYVSSPQLFYLQINPLLKSELKVLASYYKT